MKNLNLDVSDRKYTIFHKKQWVSRFSISIICQNHGKMITFSVKHLWKALQVFFHLPAFFFQHKSGHWLFDKFKKHRTLLFWLSTSMEPACSVSQAAALIRSLWCGSLLWKWLSGFSLACHYVVAHWTNKSLLCEINIEKVAHIPNYYIAYYNLQAENSWFYL